MKLDIKRVIKAIEGNDVDFPSKLSDAEVVELEKNIKWLIPQWITCSRDNKKQAEMIVMFNAVCNPIWKTLDSDMAYKLLSVIGNGYGNHTFYPPKRTKKDVYYEALLEYIPDLKPDEVDLVDIEQLHLNEDEIKELRKKR